MKSITLEQLHDDIISLKEDMNYLKNLFEENYELEDSIISDIKESRAKPKKEFVSQADMLKEFC